MLADVSELDEKDLEKSDLPVRFAAGPRPSHPRTPCHGCKMKEEKGQVLGANAGAWELPSDEILPLNRPILISQDDETKSLAAVSLLEDSIVLVSVLSSSLRIDEN
jgi:hypothetical protein